MAAPLVIYGPNTCRYAINHHDTIEHIVKFYLKWVLLYN